MNTLVQDLRYGLRMLAKNPGFTATAVLTLALGIGANVTAFSWLQTIVLDPLPGVPNPSAVVTIIESDPKGILLPFVSFPDFKEIGSETPGFAGLVGTRSAPALLERQGRSQWVSATVATANFFDVLGVRPEKGRAFLPGEDTREGGSPVAVISDELWRREFSSEPGIVGTTIVLNHHQFTVVGVAPPGFRGTNAGSHTDVWAPVAMHDAILNFGSYTSRTFRWVRPMARLRPGTNAERAEVALMVVSARLSKAYPASNAGVQFKVFPVWRSPFGGQAVFLPVLRVVMGMAAGILLIVIANVSCLLLSRAVHRQPEVTVRTALGAERWRLIQQFLTENLMLALLGGAAGLLLAAYAARWLAILIPEAAKFEYSFTLSWGTVVFAVALVLVSTLLFGVVPAYASSDTDLASALKSSGRILSRGANSRRVLNGLVITEVALALMLLIGAGLCVKGFRRAKQVELGFDPGGVVYAGLDLVPNGYSAERGKIFDRTLRDRLRGLPGVTEVSFVNTPPLGIDGAFTGQLEVAGYAARESESRNVPFVIVSAGYFRVLRIPMVEGRDFEDADDASRPNVAIINEEMARRYWPGLDPVGREFRMAVGVAPVDTFRVIGLVRTSKYNSLAEPATPLVYVTYLQRPLASLFMNLLIRTSGQPRDFMASVRREVHSLDPAVEPLSVMPMEEYIQPAFLPVRVAATLMAILSGAALALAAIGLYGVMSYAVSRLAREIGIRLALGAQPGKTVWMVVKKGMILTAAGIGAGTVASLSLSRVLARFLYGVSPTDAVTFAASGLVLCGVALAACYIPARRTMRVDPIEALRHE